MEKIITEIALIPALGKKNVVIVYPEIQKHLDEGWRIKEFHHFPFNIREIGPNGISLTVHLEKFN